MNNTKHVNESLYKKHDYYGNVKPRSKISDIVDDNSRNVFVDMIGADIKNESQASHVQDANISSDFVENSKDIDNVNIDEWYQTVKIYDVNKEISFKLDSGAQISILPLRMYEDIGEPGQLKKAKVRLSTYNRDRLDVVGTVQLDVKHKDKVYDIEFYVVNVNSVPILGLNAINKLHLIERIHVINTDTQSHKQADSTELLHRYRDVFHGIGELPGEYDIKLEEDASPVIYPVRRVPESIKPKLKESLRKMESNKIIQKVDGPTDWVNSLVIVEKPDKTLRICLDPRELNRSIRREHFHIPTLEDIQAKLSGSKFFTTLDCSAGYWQVKLSEKSSSLTTFNTPFGRYKFLRMPFGISSAQEVFQKKVSQLLEGIPGVINYIDDILIHARTEEEHDRTLEKVLQKCREAHVKLKKEKCHVKKNQTKYLGHIITELGMKADPFKVEAIVNMETPNNKQAVQRLLGMVNWLGRFIPNTSIITEPLRCLLKKEVEFHWQDSQQKAFERIKQALISSSVLKYFNVDEETTISVDASKTGLGAVLLQNSQPVAYASRSLTSTEQNYAQIEKECLAVVYGCERFHQYVYGKAVKIENDHKPLEAVFKKSLISAPPRIQRMLIRLQKYNLIYTYKKGKELWIADTLSRAHLTEKPTDLQLQKEIDYRVHCVQRDCQISNEKKNSVKEATKTDPEMIPLVKLIQDGWPNTVKKCGTNKDYFNFRDELSVCDGLVLKGNRIVIPKNLRPNILKKLHTGHWGINRTTRRARDIVFWPGITKDIEKIISTCEQCQKYQNATPKEKIMMHEVPDGPFQKIGQICFIMKVKIT